MGPAAHFLPSSSPALFRDVPQLPRPLTARRGNEAAAQTRRRGAQAPVCMVAAAPSERTREVGGHSALDLGAVGDLAPQQMAQLLRLAHLRSVNGVHVLVVGLLDMHSPLSCLLCQRLHPEVESGRQGAAVSFLHCREALLAYGCLCLTETEPGFLALRPLSAGRA